MDLFASLFASLKLDPEMFANNNSDSALAESDEVFQQLIDKFIDEKAAIHQMNDKGAKQWAIAELNNSDVEIEPNSLQFEGNIIGVRFNQEEQNINQNHLDKILIGVNGNSEPEQGSLLPEQNDFLSNNQDQHAIALFSAQQLNNSENKSTSNASQHHSISLVPQLNHSDHQASITDPNSDELLAKALDRTATSNKDELLTISDIDKDTVAKNKLFENLVAEDKKLQHSFNLDSRSNQLINNRRNDLTAVNNQAQVAGAASTTSVLSGLTGISEPQSVLATGSVQSEQQSVIDTKLTQSTPERSSQWSNELGQKLKLLINNQIKEAKIAVDPPELGPISVKLSVQNQDAQVMFQAQHSQTREALEFALPRLRELLEASGLNLTDANVSEQGKEQSQQSKQQLADDPDAEANNLDEQTSTKVFTETQVSLNKDGIDFYA